MATPMHTFHCLTSILIFFSIFLQYFPLIHSLSFGISRFDPQSLDIIYEGDARPNVGTIDFTSPTYACHVGMATYAHKVPIWDSGSNRVTDFTSRFSFSIDTWNQSSGQYAAGLAFFLAPVGFHIPVNSVGGFLGLFNTTTSDSSQNQIVMIEFDTFVNEEWDPPYQHVGINKNSISSVVTTRWNATFHSQDIADVMVAYNGTTKNLTVSWSYRLTENPNENTSLSYSIDLMTVLPEWVVIGFSAATSYRMERHQVLSWSFISDLNIKEGTAKSNIVRLAVGIGLPVGLLIIAGVVGIIWFARKKQPRSERNKQMSAEERNLTSINDELERGAGPRRFFYKDLASATNNFSADRKLGQGGFGAVYRGYFVNSDTLVAVKKISRGSRQGKKQFINEVKIISSVRHRNLVQLIGWCHEGTEFLLVYEFMPNGSLDSHLFGNRNPLSWQVRYKIMVGIASGLLYLHEEWEQCVVHRDIKSSNIMLDSNFGVKLGDFGLARLMDHELGPQTTGLAGTFGYLAPEYVSTGRASKEADVYSFGVVVLEIVTGRKSVDPFEHDSHTSLVEWAWNLYGCGELLSGVDKRLPEAMDFDRKQAECLMIVGLWCAHPDRNLRPSIRQALQVLNFEVAAPKLPSHMPVAVYHIPTPSVSSGEPFISSSMDEGR